MDYPNLKQHSMIAFDTETTGLIYPTDKVFGFSVSTPKGDYYYDIRVNPKSVEWFNDSVDDYDGDIICHNASFDYRMASETGFIIPINQLDDTVIRACIIDEHLYKYDLDSLALKYTGKGKYGNIYQELADMFGGMATRNMQMPNLQHAPPETVSPYAKDDTRATFDLYRAQQHIIDKEDLNEIAQFERSLLPTFIRAEMRGIRVDLDYVEEAMHNLTPIINDTQSRLNLLAGGNVNVNSTPQVRTLFEPKQHKNGSWTAYDGTPMEKTGGGQPSVNADFLRDISARDDKAQLILEIRSLLKTRDTFLGKHVVEHAIDGRVYPTINQAKSETGGTGTGRISYTNPAMQQIPSRNKKVAAIVKPAFLPDEGMVWVDCDMASFEVRVFAHLVNNMQIIKAYNNEPKMDLHQFVADITGLVRNAEYSGQPNAKQLNLSMIFNSGNGAIADKMGMDWKWEKFQPSPIKEPSKWITYKKPGKEAMEIINMYHKKFPGIKELAEDCSEEALDRGYVQTQFGRRLRFPDGHKAYKASGLLIQATAADLNKENWRIVDEELGDQGFLTLNTHDSYSLCLPEDWKPHYNRIKSRVEARDRLRVPLVLDWSGAGHNWHQALQGKDIGE